MTDKTPNPSPKEILQAMDLYVQELECLDNYQELVTFLMRTQPLEVEDNIVTRFMMDIVSGQGHDLSSFNASIPMPPHIKHLMYVSMTLRTLSWQMRQEHKAIKDFENFRNPDGIVELVALLSQKKPTKPELNSLEQSLLYEYDRLNEYAKVAEALVKFRIRELTSWSASSYASDFDNIYYKV